jgi:hypothetical protein
MATPARSNLEKPCIWFLKAETVAPAERVVLAVQVAPAGMGPPRLLAAQVAQVALAVQVVRVRSGRAATRIQHPQASRSFSRSVPMAALARQEAMGRPVLLVPNRDRPATVAPG